MDFNDSITKAFLNTLAVMNFKEAQPYARWWTNEWGKPDVIYVNIATYKALIKGLK